MDDTAATSRSLGIEGRLALGVVLERLTGTRAPTRLGRYEVRERLGAGGCGVVFTGWDPELQRDVAIKVLLPAGDPTDDLSPARARLLREAQALARLRHRNVVEVFDVGVDLQGSGRDRVYIVMELLRGRTLAEWAEAIRPSWRVALARWQDVIAAIAAAHAAGIVHRDVKPANVMLTEDGRIKVLDFGLARAQRVPTDPMESSEPTLDDSALTQSGAIMGTPRYMAPEQHDGAEVTAATDQFAVCACMFEALHGVRAFPGRGLDAIAEQKRRGPPARPRDTDVPAGVYAALARGMSPDPAARFPDLHALDQALRNGLRRRGRSRAAVAGLALAAVSGTAVLAADARPEACETAPAFTWNEAEQAAVREGAVIHGAPRADRTWERLRSRVSDAQTRLLAARRDACEVEPSRSQAQLEALACVDRSEHEIAAALEGLRLAGEASSDPRADLRRLWRWTGRHPCKGASLRPSTPDEREVLERIATELDEHTRLLSADRVDTTLAFIERALPTVDALGDTTTKVRLLELRGRALGSAGHYAEAAAALTEAIWMAEGEGDHATSADLVPSALHHLIEAGATAEEIDRVERLGLELAARADEPGPAAAELDVMRGLARIRRGDLDGAETAFLAAESLGNEVALGEVATARARLGLSGVYLMRDQHARAERYARAVLDDPPPVPSVRAGMLEEAHQRLGLLSFFRGDLDAAAGHMLTVIESAESELGPDHPALAFPLSFYGEVLFQRGDGDEAIAHMERARAIALATVGWEHPMLGHILNNMALAEASRKNLNRALELAREAREHTGLDHPPDSRDAIDSDVLLADVLVDMERWDEARPLVKRALAHYGDEVRSALENAAGRLAKVDGDLPRAEAHLRRALEGLDPQSPQPTDRGARGLVVWELARVRLARDDAAEARELAAHARTLLASGNPWQRAIIGDLDAWTGAQGFAGDDPSP